jgi:hypothetical protein
MYAYETISDVVVRYDAKLEGLPADLTTWRFSPNLGIMEQTSRFCGQRQSGALVSLSPAAYTQAKAKRDFPATSISIAKFDREVVIDQTCFHYFLVFNFKN